MTGAPDEGVAPGSIVVTVDTGVAELDPDPDLPDAWLLRLNGTPQSHVNLTDPTLLAFDYIRRISDIADVLLAPGPLDVLHLGAGALSLPRCLAALRPGSRQHVVDVDAALMELVQTHLPWRGPDPPELEIADAADALQACPRDSVDLIVADVFRGAQVPGRLLEPPFARAAARALRADGCYIANLLDRGRLDLTRRHATALQAFFREVAVVAEADTVRRGTPANVLVVAADQPLRELVRVAAAEITPMRLLTGRELAELSRR